MREGKAAQQIDHNIIDNREISEFAELTAMLKVNASFTRRSMTNRGLNATHSTKCALQQRSRHQPVFNFPEEAEQDALPSTT